LSETIRNEKVDNHIIDPAAPSAARVVWDHYGALDAFPEAWLGMMEAVDRGDSAQFNKEQVLNPEGWDLLNFLMDARTGLGRFREFRISNYNLMMDLIDYCKNHTIDDVMKLPDVKERVTLYNEQDTLFKQQLKNAAQYMGIWSYLICEIRKLLNRGIALSFMHYIQNVIYQFMSCGAFKNKIQFLQRVNLYLIVAQKPT
jgi:nanoRNase/pAp phosphatase (c-di-AMP/oligoRNAs hydrolase)